jgi:photosystem II stability/assembly factor-like uncharacterized protein
LWGTRAAVAAALGLAFGAATLAAQATTSATATQPQFKGILEAVSYTEDLDLNDVVFVNADVGWVAGDAGTILRTVDGGKTWEAQLGGDPASRAEAVRKLHFLDERRGWAVQGRKLLHTSDGDNWEEIGSLPYGARGLTFTSPQLGFVAGYPEEISMDAGVIYRTTDGGRTWKKHWTCTAKVSLGGLSRQLSCNLWQLQFPTPQVGYAVARNPCHGMGCAPPPLLAKTTDGGESWQTLLGPGVADQDAVSSIFFLDERTGFARLESKKLHMTTDGGETWRGIVAEPGEAIRFADPTVGWGVALGWSALRWSYTTDGGRRWNSREVSLPATIKAFSMPRRDRAYVVGDHGMVFRYRVVPATHPLGPNDKLAPAMPGFESPLDEQVAQLEQVVGALGTELNAAPGGGGGAAAGGGANADSAAASAAADSTAAASEPLDAPLPPPSDYTANCCKKSFSRLEVVLGALSQSLPEFIGKYRNLNLLLAAVRMGVELPDEYRSVKGGLRAFRKAQDKESAAAALAGLSAVLSAFKQTTSVSMQQQLPPAPPPGGGAPAQASPPTSAPQSSPAPGQASSPTPVADAIVPPVQSASAAGTKVGVNAKSAPESAVKDSSSESGKEAVKGAAALTKKGLGGLLKKKIP